MKMRWLAAALGLLAALAGTGQAGASVTVEFVAPREFTDAGDVGRDNARNLAVLQRYMVMLGGKCLRPGEALALRVLDVDLAGRQEGWRGASQDVRVIRDITWPRMELEYSWRDASGKVLGQGRERISDMNYLWRIGPARYYEELPCEKAMLTEWFAQRFCRRGEH